MGLALLLLVGAPASACLHLFCEWPGPPGEGGELTVAPAWPSSAHQNTFITRVRVLCGDAYVLVFTYHGACVGSEDSLQKLVL